LGVIFSTLAVILPHFFAFIFNIDFSSIFFIDFEMVLGGFWEAKIVKNSKIWVFFGVCFWRAYFLLKFA